MKKMPLKYIALLILSIILLISGAAIIGRVFVNASFVQAYNEGQYDTSAEEKILYLNYPEGYIPYYNLGNAAYQKGEYLKAAGFYAEALNYSIPEGNDCQVRINYALALCYSIDFDNLKTEDDIKNALTILYTAREALMKNGCANDEGTGHNADAQQLKDDIDKMIDKLENPEENDNDNEQNQNQSQNNQDDQNDQQNQSGQSSREKQQREQLQQNKENALEERKQDQNQMETENKRKQQWQSGSDGEDQDGSDSTGNSGEDGQGGSGSQVNPW